MVFRDLLTASLLGVVLGWVHPASASEPQADEPEMMRYPPSSVRVGLIAGGLGLTALAYTPAVLSAFAWPEVPGSDGLKAPVVGPWIALAESGCAEGEQDCEAVLALRTILYIVSGLAQAGGLAVAAEGIFMTTEAESEEAIEEQASAPALEFVVAPTVSDRTLGLGVVGRF